ncbi:META domain-containing protein [Streptomyces sp. NPDC008313]|uniref:META domain-containing protein n=1 Tax=Streptomyces sp. NPDC008313 TaxID=3364826 RepID=UPI0036EFC2CD
MYRHRLTLTALALLPLAAACGTQKAGSGSVDADGTRITGVHWTVDSVTVDGATHRAPDGAGVEIGEDGDVRGDYGCNHFRATATVRGDRISLGDTTKTEMACEDGPMAFENTLARTLADGPLQAEAEKGTLTLTTGDGDRVRLTERQDAPLGGTRWKVTGIGTSNAARPLPKEAGKRTYLTFDTKHSSVGGRLGCNRVSAHATVRDGHITLGRPITTRMMCDRSLMTVEKSLLGLFDGTVSYRVDHRTMTLTSENGTTVSAVAEK